MRDPLEEATGVKVLDIVFGAWGSLIAIALLRVKRYREGIVSFLAGLGSSLVFPAWVRHWLWDYPTQLHNGVVFLLGLSGMMIVRFAYTKIRAIIQGAKLTAETKVYRGRRNA